MPPDTLKLVRDVARPGIVFALARVPGTGRCFLGGSDAKIYQTDLDQPKPEFTEIGAHASYVTGLAVAGSAVVSGSYDGKLIWWDPDRREPIRSVEAHAKWVRGVVATRDGRLVASVADDMVARLWDGATGKLRHELRGHAERTPNHFPSMLYAVALSPDGRHVATADRVGHIVVWETETGKPAATVEVPTMYTWDPMARIHSIGGVRALAFSADGSILAAGGTGKVGNIDHLDAKARVEAFDWRKGERVFEQTLDSFKGLVEHLEFAPHGDWLAAAGGANDGFLALLDAKTGKALWQEKVSSHVHAFALNDAADTVYAAGHGKVWVYQMKA